MAEVCLVVNLEVLAGTREYEKGAEKKEGGRIGRFDFPHPPLSTMM